MTKRRPRILFISSNSPFPLDVGVKIRLGNLLHAVSDIADVDFVGYSFDSLVDNYPSEDMLNDISVLCQTVRICSYPSSNTIGKKQVGKIIKNYFINDCPVIYSEFLYQPLVTMATPLAECADLIWIERLHVAHWFKAFRHKIIVDIDDLDSVKLERQIALEPPSFLTWSKTKQIGKLQREEKCSIECFSRLVVCSEKDKAMWPSAKENRIWVVPNGADDQLFNHPKQDKIPNSLIFVGTMSYQPNEDAVRFFCAEILPILTKRAPGISLMIVGKNPPQNVMQLQDDERIKVIADVPDVAPYVKKAMLSIVPLRVGGGTRLKILESLALGTPVVSTSIGAEGLNLTANRDLVLADSPELFADSILDLLANQEKYSTISLSGEQAVKKQYSWSRIRHHLSNKLTKWLQ